VEIFNNWISFDVRPRMISLKLRTLKAVVLLGVAVFFLSCASGAHYGSRISREACEELATEPPRSGSAAVYFCREANFNGFAIPLRVREGGIILVDVENGSSVRFELAPGKHRFSMSSIVRLFGEMPTTRECDLELNLEAGTTRYVSLRMPPDVILGNGGGLSELSPSKGLEFAISHPGRTP
jgi:hypothetical protein